MWTLVDPHEGIVLIKRKWIYKRKIDSNSKVETYKARLVVKSYSQKEGIDFEEIVLLLVMLKSIQILIAIATHLDYEIS